MTVNHSDQAQKKIDVESTRSDRKGFAGLIRDCAKNGNYKNIQHDLDRIDNAADKMQNLLKDLLELSRIGRIINPSENVKFGEIVLDVVELLTGTIKEKRKKINMNGIPGIRAAHLSPALGLGCIGEQ